MKTKRATFIVGLLSASLCVTAVIQQSYRKSRNESVRTLDEDTNSNSLVSKPISQLQNSLEKEEDPIARHNAIASQFDTRIRFWGKVVNQAEIPLEGVKIVATVTTLRMIKAENGYREYEVVKATTDASGAFMFDGSNGMYLDIEALSKDGYVLPSAYQFGMSCVNGAKFRYKYRSIGDLERVFTPNSSSPEVFHMWKLNKPEPLVICGDGSGHCGPRLKVGAPTELFGALSMMITSVGTPLAPQWEVTVSAIEPDGGVIKADSSDIFMFMAPESGYTQSIRFRYGLAGSDQGAGDPGASLRFFARTHQGRRHFASEYAFFSPDRDGSVETTMRLWLNPSGSRNLEHDGGHPLPEPSLRE